MAYRFCCRDRREHLVLARVLVYICQNRRRTGIGIVGPAGELKPGDPVKSRNSQRYDGKAGWPPQTPEVREQREASEQIQGRYKRKRVARRAAENTKRRDDH